MLPARLPKRPKRESRWRSPAHAEAMKNRGQKLALWAAATRTCERCGRVFGRKDKPNMIFGAFMKQRFCSRECSHVGTRHDHVSFFLAHIEKHPDGCWLWTGPLMNKGYGVIHVNGQKRYAHRYSHEYYKGPCDDLHVLHSCDNPPCVNPDHLRLGTHQENMRDAVERKRLRHAKGEKHHAAILTAKQVEEVLSSSAKGTTLAKRFGVSKSTIYAIRRGQNWRAVSNASG